MPHTTAHAVRQGSPDPQGVLANLAFPLLIIGGLVFLQRRSGGGGGGANPFEIGRSKSKVQMEPETGVGFSDVAGCDASKLELTEARDQSSLHHPRLNHPRFDLLRA